MALTESMIEAARTALLREAAGGQLSKKQVKAAAGELVGAALRTGSSPEAAAVETHEAMRQLIDGDRRVRPGGPARAVAETYRSGSPVRETVSQATNGLFRADGTPVKPPHEWTDDEFIAAGDMLADHFLPPAPRRPNWAS